MQPIIIIIIFKKKEVIDIWNEGKKSWWWETEAEEINEGSCWTDGQDMEMRNTQQKRLWGQEGRRKWIERTKSRLWLQNTAWMKQCLKSLLL